MLKMKISIFNNVWKREIEKEKKDFFTIQPVIEYLFEKGSLRL